VAEFCIIRREVRRDRYRQLQAAEGLSKLSTMNDKLSFMKVPLVIAEQLLHDH
jgi:hypothetical protein